MLEVISFILEETIKEDKEEEKKNSWHYICQFSLAYSSVSLVAQDFK